MTEADSLHEQIELLEAELAWLQRELADARRAVPASISVLMDDDTLRGAVDAIKTTRLTTLYTTTGSYETDAIVRDLRAAAPILTAAKDRRIAELEAALSTVVIEHDGHFSTAEAWRVARAALAGSAGK